VFSPRFVTSVALRCHMGSLFRLGNGYGISLGVLYLRYSTPVLRCVQAITVWCHQATHNDDDIWHKASRTSPSDRRKL
jgi:hypothetical protein